MHLTCGQYRLPATRKVTIRHDQTWWSGIAQYITMVSVGGGNHGREADGAVGAFAIPCYNDLVPLAHADVLQPLKHGCWCPHMGGGASPQTCCRPSHASDDKTASASQPVSLSPRHNCS